MIYQWFYRKTHVEIVKQKQFQTDGYIQMVYRNHFIEFVKKQLHNDGDIAMVIQ